MLNEYVTKKTNMSTILKNVDETMKLKRLGLDTSANSTKVVLKKKKRSNMSAKGLFGMTSFIPKYIAIVFPADNLMKYRTN